MRSILPIAVLTLTAAASGQAHTPSHVTILSGLDSGWVENDAPRWETISSFTVTQPGSTWIRLYFDEVELWGDFLAGRGAKLRLTAHIDGAVMEMDARHVEQWQKSSCYFNGDAVQVEIWAPPGAGASRVSMRAFDAGIPPADGSICGSDDRVLSSDPRAARLMPVGCTSWMIDDCAKCFLTAGHCTGSISVVQFNVPLSNSNGSLNNPHPDDQYAVDSSSLQTNGGQGVGEDFAYFGVFANSNTGLTAYQAQGSAFELSLPPSNPSGNTIRITGYGTDSTPATHNQVQQTNAGPMVVSDVDQELGYRTDTTGGNSGSPVIWENTGKAVGIHTHGGCSSSGGNNWGTSVGNPGLQAYLDNPKGICQSAGFTHPDGIVDLISPGVPTAVFVDVSSSTASNITFHYRYDGGAFIPIPMTPFSGDTWTADFPPPTCDDVPEFFFSLDDNVCGTRTSPEGAPADYYSAIVGVFEASLADDFEVDLGWTAVNLGASNGDFERGVPVNDPNWSYDPTADFDGSGSCYLTENQFGNSDVDGGAVGLVSPGFSFQAGGEITYAYFLNMTIPQDTDYMAIQGSDSGAGGPWTTIVTHAESGGLSWREHTVTAAEWTAAGLAFGTSHVRFFVIDGGAQFNSIVEAGVDAFRVGYVTCGDDEIGSRYCTPAVNNSTGAPGVIRVNGSDAVMDNNLTLTAESLPQSQFGYFLTSQTQAFVPNPGGSEGNLCVGGTIGRFVKEVQNSGPDGTISIPVDLTDLPAPLGSVQAGETWNYTTWFRDLSPNPTSNFTDAVSVTFQ